MNKFIFAALLCFAPLAQGTFYSGNTISDTFTVTKIESGLAYADGISNNLKAGDYLYFARSPYKFSIKSVTEKQIVVILPAKNDVKVGNTLIRNSTDFIKKALDTELKVNSALEE